MATIRVKYTVEFEETIDWPDDELESLTYDNLLINLDFENNHDFVYEDITRIVKDGVEFDFE